MNKIPINFDVFSDERITDGQRKVEQYIKKNQSSIIKKAKVFLMTQFDDAENRTVNCMYIFRGDIEENNLKFAVLFDLNPYSENDFPCVVFENGEPVNCGYDRYLI